MFIALRRVLFAAGALLAATHGTVSYAGASYFVQPMSSCSANGDGRSASCATVAGGAGAWNSLAKIRWVDIRPNDTLKMTGLFSEGLTVGASGDGTGNILIDGRDAVIDGNNTIGICVNDGGNRNFTITGLEVKNCYTRGFYFPNSHMIENQSGVVLAGVSVHDIRSRDGQGADQANCIWGKGANARIVDSTIYNCGDDGIWWAGDRIAVVKNDIRDVGLDDGNGSDLGIRGDCIQLTNTVTDFSIAGNRCDHRSRSEKQCIIVGALPSIDPHGGGEIVDNTCLMPTVDPRKETKVIFNGQNGVVIARNLVVGGHFGIWSPGRSTIVSNLVVNFAAVGIYTPGTINSNTEKSLVAYNTVDGGAAVDTNYCYGNYSSPDTEFTNNIAIRCGTAFFGYGTGNSTWSNNLNWQTTWTYSFNNLASHSQFNTITGVDPNFTNVSGGAPSVIETAGDGLAYQLKSTSPAIGVGITPTSNVAGDADALAHDLLYIARPNGRTLGAFEPYECVSDLVARAKTGKVQLTWTNDPNAASYNIYRSTMFNGLYVKIDNATSTYSTYLDKAVENGTTYYYLVRGVTLSSVEFCQSNPVSAMPDLR